MPLQKHDERPGSQHNHRKDAKAPAQASDVS